MDETYQIEELLGRGGFGSVYRAELAGAGGFRKQVAVKLLHDAHPAPAVLRRLRDESRILGLIVDRAIVSAQPPKWFGGQWSVIMEYVPGETLDALVTRHGPLPPALVLRVVGEIARVLDVVWNQVVEGAPLQLMHRDIKPANLQLTPTGDVKLLDFGLAKAVFESRESDTTMELSGTPGFIAPERYVGGDGDRSDIYSLGVVMHILLTGDKPKAARREGDPPSEDPLVEMALSMCHVDPDERPTAPQVYALAGQLERVVPRLVLAEWAKENVQLSSLPPDERVGMLLSPGPIDKPDVRSEVEPGLACGPLVGMVAGAVALGSLLLVLIGLGGAGGLLGWTVSRDQAVVPVRPPTTPSLPSVGGEGDQRPVRTENSRRAQHTIDVLSIPPRALVKLNGRTVGQTPLDDLAVSEGPYTITLVATSGVRSTHPFVVGPRGPSSLLWMEAVDQWTLD